MTPTKNVPLRADARMETPSCLGSRVTGLFGDHWVEVFIVWAATIAWIPTFAGMTGISMCYDPDPTLLDMVCVCNNRSPTTYLTQSGHLAPVHFRMCVSHRFWDLLGSLAEYR